MKLFQNSSEILAEQVQEVGLPEELLPILDQLTHHRQGWVKRGVNEEGTIENAKQHVAKVALAAAAIDGQRWGITNTRLRIQAIIHELPEVLSPDWTPGEISETEKFQQEKANLEKLLSTGFPQRQQIIKSWLDYERNKDLAYFLDKMDAIVTAEYYALINPAYLSIADEFHAYGQQKIQDKTLLKILEQIKQAARSNDPGAKLTPENIFPTYFDLLSDC
ncbi:MAG: HD domain-containing protein [Candidatus Altimarinota bacterium]